MGAEWEKQVMRCAVYLQFAPVTTTAATRSTSKYTMFCCMSLNKSCNFVARSFRGERRAGQQLDFFLFHARCVPFAWSSIDRKQIGILFWIIKVWIALICFPPPNELDEIFNAAINKLKPDARFHFFLRHPKATPREKEKRGGKFFFIHLEHSASKMIIFLSR